MGMRAGASPRRLCGVTGHTESDLMSFCQQGIYLVVDSLTSAG